MCVCLYVLCGHLLGKGWPLGSRLWCLLWVCHFPHWYPRSGVVLDCIDSWSLHLYLIWYAPLLFTCSSQAFSHSGTFKTGQSSIRCLFLSKTSRLLIFLTPVSQWMPILGYMFDCTDRSIDDRNTVSLISNYITKLDLSHNMRFPTMWYVRPANAQTSLRICAVCSEPLLVPWIFYDCQATDWTAFGVSKLKRRLHCQASRL